MTVMLVVGHPSTSLVSHMGSASLHRLCRETHRPARRRVWCTKFGPVAVVAGSEVNLMSTVAPAPSITTLSPTSGAVGALVTITGTNFGTSQGTSTVKFNGTATATVPSWSADRKSVV